MTGSGSVCGLDNVGSICIFGVILLNRCHMKSKKAAQTKIDAVTKNKQWLARTVKQVLEAAQARGASVPLLERAWVRYELQQKHVDATFSGHLFLSDEPPTSPKNLRRFKTNVEMLRSLTKLKINLIHELMRAHGVDPNHPNEMCGLPMLLRESKQPEHPRGGPTRRSSS